MKTVKKALLFALCLLPVAVAGGWFTAKYAIASVDASVIEEAVNKVGSIKAVTVLTAANTVLYAVVFGFAGYILSEKLGLMRPFTLRKSETLRTLPISAVCGALLSLDAWTFGRLIPEVGSSYAGAGSFDAPTWIASVLYGGVIEEVLLRLFLMSLLALLGWKLFFRREETVPVRVLIAANIIAALVFAAGHLPVTAATFGQLTPLLILRCFALNGAAGLLFGRFYRRYGIQYAMLAHMMFHLVSRTVWLIAIP